MGPGVYTNFSLGFADQRGWLHKCAETLLAYLATKGVTDARANDRFARIIFTPGAQIAGAIKLNKGWYPMADPFEEKLDNDPAVAKTFATIEGDLDLDGPLVLAGYDADGNEIWDEPEMAHLGPPYLP